MLTLLKVAAATEFSASGLTASHGFSDSRGEANGNPTSDTGHVVSSSTTPVASYSYDQDARGRVTQEMKVIYFGASGNFRLQQLKTGTSSNPTSLQDLRYTYDNVGNVLTIKDYKAGSPQTQSFSYDFLDRLLSASVSGGSGGLYSEGYEYSGNGGKIGT